MCYPCTNLLSGRRLIVDNNIRTLRLASKKTQTQVARDLGVNIETYRSWEYGKRNPTGKMAIKLAQYFGATTDTVLGSSYAEPIKWNLSSEEETLIDMYRKLSNESKLAVKTVAYALLVSQTETRAQ